jgi:TPP-dependent 2-oxoacid decarboxylase
MLREPMPSSFNSANQLLTIGVVIADGSGESYAEARKEDHCVKSNSYAVTVWGEYLRSKRRYWMNFSMEGWGIKKVA